MVMLHDLHIPQLFLEDVDILGKKTASIKYILLKFVLLIIVSCVNLGSMAQTHFILKE
jgi:hypothetical protein